MRGSSALEFIHRYSNDAMRLTLIVLIVSLGLLAAGVLQPAASQSTAQPAKELDASLADQADAAEKHAKRTACLKEAKSKKLVGAQKTAYVKDCMASDPPSSSSSSNSP
jgi:hypothetical protein